MCDYHALADLLFPDIDKTLEDYEAIYPSRDLPKGAKVTRIAPSPTGFIHLGNLFGAIVDERLAHQSGGVFYLRIEDTDQKRKVEGAVDLILNVFPRFGLKFDEGVTSQGEKGDYGPYVQRQRREIYQTAAKSLVQRGLAYPCFCTEEEISALREKQTAEGANPGYYGRWAACRSLSFDEISEKLKAGIPFVLRLRSNGNPENTVKVKDLVKGDLEFPENDLDVVLLKSDGIPTYHFAHVVDDHFMRTTHVVRGEEWLSTFPIHLQLFETMGWRPPQFIHTAHMLKMDGGSKRKLSKRKDPELGLEYYDREGFPIDAILEYLLTVLNSNFEEWRLKNPEASYWDFKFKYEKMSSSGALFDLDKLTDISKNTVAKMSADEVYEHVLDWAERFDREFFDLLSADPAYAKAILSIGRGGKKPRKDLWLWSKAKDYMDFFYDSLFFAGNAYPSNLSESDVKEILIRYLDIYDENDDQNTWFEKLKVLAAQLGFAPETKEYKKNPTDYKGHVGDLAMVLRVAVTGKTVSPDTYAVMQVLGREKVVSRIASAAEHL